MIFRKKEKRGHIDNPFEREIFPNDSRMGMLMNRITDNPKFSRISKPIVNILMWAILVGGILWTVRVVLFSYFFLLYKVPTGSMLPTIEIGKHVIVNCRSYGLRVYNCDIDNVRHGCISRKDGGNLPEHNDIVVFNNPYYANWDSVSFDKTKYFVKRCIALPGDTFEIRGGYYHVSGFDGELGYIKAQEEVEEVTRDSSAATNQNIAYWTAPFYHPVYHWNMREMGPLYVPKKGDRIVLDTINAPIYKKLIEWEIDNDIVEKDGKFYVNGLPFTSHVMEQGYYFMAGDNAVYSTDSRYWGLVPEEFIVGKVVMIY